MAVGLERKKKRESPRLFFFCYYLSSISPWTSLCKNSLISLCSMEVAAAGKVGSRYFTFSLFESPVYSAPITSSQSLEIRSSFFLKKNAHMSIWPIHIPKSLSSFFPFHFNDGIKNPGKKLAATRKRFNF